jgi:3'-phosphoadenosine 5'-phosphosulfate sulfotransferase (PAPS reductase)/FAD synthetase
MIALAFSGGKDSMACLHLMRDVIDCAIYIDTGYTYPETELMVHYASNIVHLHRVCVDRKAQNDREGIPAEIVPVDWTRLGQEVGGKKSIKLQSYLGCCWDNISWPLISTAKKLGVTQLIVGQREQDWKKAPVGMFSVIEGIERVQPINDWTTEDVIRYLETKMDIPPHYFMEHSSLDCYDCPAYSQSTKDRVAWTKIHYPDFAEAREIRRKAIETALHDAQEMEHYDNAKLF